MKKLWAVIAMLSALCCVSCDDDNKEAEPCVNGTRVCTNNILNICVNGEYQATPCAVGMFCSADATRCVECNDNVMPFCSVDGIHVNTVQYCSDGRWRYTECGAKQCQAQDNYGNAVAAHCYGSGAATTGCTPGAAHCNVSGQREVCGNNGQWGTPVNCPSGTSCYQGECRVNVVCTDNAVQCAENQLQVCSGGQWQTTKTCDVASQKCSASKKDCVDKNALPDAGESCDDDFESVCGSDGNFYYCGSDDRVQALECNKPGELVCKTLANGEDDCLYDGVECSEVGEVASLFKNSCDYGEQGVILYVACVKVDGQFYGQEAIAQSVCVADSGVNYVISCNKTAMAEQKCSAACTYTPGKNDYDGLAKCN